MLIMSVLITLITFRTEKFRIKNIRRNFHLISDKFLKHFGQKHMLLVLLVTQKYLTWNISSVSLQNKNYRNTNASSSSMLLLVKTSAMEAFWKAFSIISLVSKFMIKDDDATSVNWLHYVQLSFNVDFVNVFPWFSCFRNCDAYHFRNFSFKTVSYCSLPQWFPELVTSNLYEILVPFVWLRSVFLA